MLLFFSLASSSAAAAPAEASPTFEDPHAVVAPVAAQVAAVTGIAISPLLGCGAYGVWQWWQVRDGAPEQKAGLPWYAQVYFWLPALLLAGLCAAKDALGTALPSALKKPADVLEAFENQLSGLLVLVSVVPVMMLELSRTLAVPMSSAGGASFASTRGLAMASGAFFDGASTPWVLGVALVVLGSGTFAIVWMASHAINVLILLSPWGVIDAALKGSRTALLGVIVVASVLEPWVSLVVSGAVIVFAWLVAGWSFRLTVFGTVFSWELLSLRRLRFTPHATENGAFSGALLKQKGVPLRSYGRFSCPEGGQLLFAYRPWLILPVRRVALEVERPAVARGLLFSTIGDARDATALILPPRFCGHERVLANAYQLEGGVREAGLRKAWASFLELVAGVGWRRKPISASG